MALAFPFDHLQAQRYSQSVGMTAEVIQHPSPNLADIPAMLRRLADQIEAGDWGEVETAFLLMPRAGDFPRLFGWGNVTGTQDPIVQFEMAKHWLVTNLVSR